VVSFVIAAGSKACDGVAVGTVFLGVSVAGAELFSP
jgi:nicotinamide mononucleotide (NMN) deamidase PncC